MSKTITVSYIVYNEDSEEDQEVTLELPAIMKVCYDCDGHGYVLNESMRNHCYSEEEFNETFWDDKDKEQYLKRGGIYDVECPTCRGANVVPVVNEAAIPSHLKEEYNTYKKWAREDAMEREWEEQQYRMERMMGA